MTIKNGNIPTMPIQLAAGEVCSKEYDTADGLTKREMIAMHMMAHLMPNERLQSYEEQASYALMAADALLAELERTNGN